MQCFLEECIAKKNPKVLWYILGQLSSLQISGRWLLVTGFWPEARSKKPEAGTEIKAVFYKLLVGRKMG